MRKDDQIADILFDLGKVLVTFDWDIALQRLLPHLKEETAREVAKSKENFIGLFRGPGIALEKGQIDFDEFYNDMRNRLGISVGKDEFQYIWCDIFEMNEDMIMLGKELSGKYRTWLVSNTSQAHYRWILEKFPLVAFYRDAALSFELGSMKPSQEYYRGVIDKFGIEPARTVFIDDLPENVVGALRAGMKGIVFRGIEHLVAELKLMGVKVPGAKEKVKRWRK
jgi:glucose-1-phosphatase